MACIMFSRPIVLDTGRLIIREHTKADLALLLPILQDDETMRMYGGGFSYIESKRWLSKQFKRYKRDGVGLWAVMLKDRNEFIGQCGILYQDWGGVLLPCIGYVFNKLHWHNGYATEAVLSCVSFALDILGLESVYAIIPDTNLPSQRVAERCGFEQRSISHKVYNGIKHCVYLYVKDRQCADGV